MKNKKVDRLFLVSIILLVVAGFFIFSSASLGYQARQQTSYATIVIKQFLVGFGLGGLILIITSRIPYTFWRKYAFYIFLLSIVACIAIFIPGFGFSHGGAKRWLGLGPYTVQPAELLKLGAVVYFAAWVATVKEKIKTFKYGALGLFIVIAITGALLMKQPDTGTYMVLFLTLVAMFVSAGGKWRYIFILFIICSVSIITLAQYRPYLMARFTTFLDPSSDPLSSGYQIQQSLIAIGSGGIFGRGYGQSVQKFNFLPEPIGDSIFAVACEEFGFIGALTLVILFLFFALRGYKIASRIKDPFGMILCVGLVTLVIVQAFINIGAMLGVLPLTGIPLPFISHGGTAMLFALAEVGIVLNISKYQKI